MQSAKVGKCQFTDASVSKLFWPIHFGSDMVQKIFGPSKELKGYVWILPPILLPFPSSNAGMHATPPPSLLSLSLRV